MSLNVTFYLHLTKLISTHLPKKYQNQHLKYYVVLDYDFE